MDVYLPAEFLALRACVDSDWRDGCSASGARKISDDAWQRARARKTEHAQANQARLATRTVTLADVDPGWLAI